MSSPREQILGAMGLTVWRRRHTPATDEFSGAPDSDQSVCVGRATTEVASIITSETLPETEHIRPSAPANWESLQQQVSECELCPLAGGRIQTVFGTGNTDADWMIVGEAPGAEEDRQGLPFVGRAGQLLNAMLAALKMERNDVFIANVLKCRPPNNRDPLGEEVSKCSPYLESQIQLIRPKMILALGRFAAQALLETHTPISKLRGQLHHYGALNTPLVVSYHPAYLLRSPLEKRKAWEDLKFAARAMDESTR